MLGSLGSTLSNTYHRLCGDTKALSSTAKSADAPVTSLNGDTHLSSAQGLSEDVQGGERSLKDKMADVQIAVYKMMQRELGHEGREAHKRARDIFTRGQDPTLSEEACGAQCEEWRRGLCERLRDGLRDDTTLANACRPGSITFYPRGHERYKTAEEFDLEWKAEKIERARAFEEFFAAASNGQREGSWANMTLEETVDETFALIEEIRELGKKKDDAAHFAEFGTRRELEDRDHGCHCGLEYSVAVIGACLLATFVATGVAGYRWAKAGSQGNMYD